jgi:hypothetical protein
MKNSQDLRKLLRRAGDATLFLAHVCQWLEEMSTDDELLGATEIIIKNIKGQAIQDYERTRMQFAKDGR